jgi:osmoprotectant transport system ATP-binding protein
MINLEAVTKMYGTAKAVDAFTLDVNTGEVCVIIGPSGCGKTTTLRMINRLIEPTEGKIVVAGKDTATMKPEDLRRSIGYAIQSVGLFPHMTVAENIAVVPGLLHWEKGRIAGRIDELLNLIGLSPSVYAAKYPGELSGGEAQRIGVARALAADPTVLLMDEPFGAVDPLTRYRLQSQFIQIQQELHKTVILVTHDLDEAIRLADRIAVMDAGRLLQYDIPEIILSRPANKFVHDFVGADRALKRLSRLSVASFIKPSPSMSINMLLPAFGSTLGQYQWIWVVDDGQRLIGWADRNSLSKAASLADATVRADINDIAVTSHATLREALSRMLEQGFKTIPVIDEDGRLIGQVELADIEAVTVQGEQ